MKSKEELKQNIKKNIYDNNTKAITGNTIKVVLESIVDNLIGKDEWETLQSGPVEAGEGENSCRQKNTNSVAPGCYSHAEGNYTIASGVGSHAEGSNTIASGVGSHAEGGFTKAKGIASHAEGYYTIANNPYEHAQGTYNKSNNQTIYSIGIGQDDNDRKNAIEIMSDGRIFIFGVGGYDGKNAGKEGVLTLQQVIISLNKA